MAESEIIFAIEESADGELRGKGSLVFHLHAGG